MLFFCLLASVIFFSVSIFFSGNRTPLLLFGLFLILGILLVKQIRLPFILGSILSLLIFASIINTQENYKEYWQSFYENLSKLAFPGSKDFIFSEVKKDYSEIKGKTDPKDRTPGLEEGKFDYGFWKRRNFEGGFKPIPFGSGHRIIWVTAIETWLDNPIMGSGIKSFREKCKSKINTPNRVCQSHTHNYYLEILNDTGLIGIFLIIFTTYILMTGKFIERKKLDKNNLSDFVFYSIFISLILEFFPLRSSGNFFSTYNSSFIFLLLGLLLSYSSKPDINR